MPVKNPVASAIKALIRARVSEHELHHLRWHRRQFGQLSAAWAYLEMKARRDGTIRTPAPGLRAPVRLRPGTSDLDVYHQVFEWAEYDIDIRDPKIIVDAGANIGLAAAFFSARYPQARILAIEPDPGNVAVLKLNTRPYPNVEVVEAGLWGRRARLRIENPDDAPWMFRVVETDGPDSIEALSVPDLMEHLATDCIDVLKMDIEGSEREVFTSADGWIERVGMIIVETHDHYRPGCTEALNRAVAGQGFSTSQSGENIVLRRAA